MVEQIHAEIDILIEAEGWNGVAGLETLIRRAVMTALASVEDTEGARVSVLLTDDAAIQKLNAGFRGKNKPTNVLSFPAPEIPGDPEPMLGDLALAYETCAREAEEESKTITDHLTHLVIHGTLHLLGFDHEEEAEAEEMEALETALLAGLGIADPYAEDRGQAA